MKFAILIDYANLFISIRNNLKLNKITEIENEICKVISSVSDYLVAPNEHYKKGIQVIKTTAYVLDDKSFGQPEKILPQFGIEVKRVHDVYDKKTSEMKQMNLSRRDDEVLMNDGLQLVKSNKVDGIITITNDGDYSSLGEKLGYIGREFWVGVYEGTKTRASYKLKNIADLVLPLQDISAGTDEAEPLPVMDEVAAGIEEEINGPHILVYRNGKVIIKYPINKNKIGIGRRSSSRFYFPQIDLTDYDLERIVSRQHAVIHRVNNRLIFSVHQNCTRGTWLGKNPIHPYEQFILKHGTKMVIGDRNGFGLEYIEK